MRNKSDNIIWFIIEYSKVYKARQGKSAHDKTRVHKV